MNENDRNLILLLHSDELAGDSKAKAELLIQSNPDAKDYWDELTEINSIVSNSIDAAETNSTNPLVDSLARNAIFAELGPTSNDATESKDAIESNDATVTTDATPTGFATSRKATPNGLQFMFYVTASVAILLAAVSVFKIMEPSSNRLANLDDGKRSKSVTAQTTKNRAPKNANTVEGDSAPKKKRKKIRVKSDLLAKIQNTRSKIKSFKKRMEKRS